MHTKLAGIKKLNNLNIGADRPCIQCRLRLDAAENKGMKLILGNRDHGNFKNTFRTIRPVRPVKT